MRIARFVVNDEPSYGLLNEDDTLTELVGDPLYGGVHPTGNVHQVDDVRLVAPVLLAPKWSGSAGTMRITRRRWAASFPPRRCSS